MWLKYSKNSVFPKLLITKNIWVSPIQEIAFFFLVCNRTHGKPVKTGHQIDEIFSLITHFVLQHISKGKENSFGFAFVILIIYACIVLLMSVLPTNQKAAGAPCIAPPSRCSF